MHLIILDKDFQPLAPVNTMHSLLWNRRYREAGTFELHAGAADFPAIRAGSYIYRDDRDEFGIIYEADISRDKSGAKTCYAKGYFGEFLLNDRVLNNTQRLSGTPEEIARTLVDRFFINTATDPQDYEGRSLAGRLVLGDMSGEPQDSIQWQGTGSQVGQAMYDLEAAQSLSHRLRYDYENDKLIFSVWRGKDRNALLSDRYGNLTETSYHKDTTDAPNVVFVAGNGEGTSRKVYRLDLRNEGESAREMYVDARDLQQNFTGDDGQEYSYTDEDYEALLEARGRQKVADHKAQERFEVRADAKANLIYRQDYDVGDFCVAEVDGVRLDKQITGIRETYEAGKEYIEITLGDYGPTSILGAVSRQAHVNEASQPSSSGNVGDLNQLETDNKTGVVPAVNELAGDIGKLDDLKTQNKGSLVDAINEIAEGGGGTGGSVWPPATVTTNGTVNEIDRKYGPGDGPNCPGMTPSGSATTAYISRLRIAIDGPVQVPPELVGVGLSGTASAKVGQSIPVPCSIIAEASPGGTSQELFGHAVLPFQVLGAEMDTSGKALKIRLSGDPRCAGVALPYKASTYTKQIGFVMLYDNFTSWPATSGGKIGGKVVTLTIPEGSADAKVTISDI